MTAQDVERDNPAPRLSRDADSPPNTHRIVALAGVRRHTDPPSVAEMSTDLRHQLGRTGEDLVLEHVQRLGYTLVARNHRTRWGELDLIIFDGTTLVFVEVKTRRASAAGRGPWEALHARKTSQVRRMAAAYLAEARDRPRSAEIRFDAVGVVIDARGRLVRLDHLEDAF